ncbi:MAG: molybdopterin-dependent oxidoreductase [Proteobacteria bacterium]|nr:molybdopterin-dependent oxidoreductase [Pseudomonadota bacterium]
MEKTVTTYCGVCEKTCGMQVTVRDNTVEKVEGLREHVRSRGDLCIKGRAARDILYAPDRITSPMKKQNGNWTAIGWDEALDTIARKLEEIKTKYGACSLAVYHGQTYLKNCLSMFSMKRFLSLYGTPNLCSAASECFIPQLLSGITTFGSLPIADVKNSRCIIIWGANPFASGSFVGCNTRSMRVFNELKQQGVRFIMVDPRTPDSARLADIHIKPRPGTDGALALGMMRVLIDENLYDKEYVEKHTSGFDKLIAMLRDYDLEKVEKITLVPKSDIQQAARLFASVKPASIVTGNGLEHHTNTVQTLRALSILLSITGNIDVKGGNTFLSPVFLNPEAPEDMPTPTESPIGMHEHPLFVSMINQAHALAVIEQMLEKKDSPIKALLVAGGAPIPQLANTNKVKEAFKKLEFIAVIDLFMTETAQHADIVLPAAFFLERDEIATMPLNLQNKAVDGGQCWPDWKIWWELARRMGYGKYFPWKNFAEAADVLLRSAGYSHEELKKHPEGIMEETVSGKFLENGFYTFSGKIEIFSNSLESNGYDPLPVYCEPMESMVSMPELARSYPLTLTTGARQPMYLHSQHRNIPTLRKHMPEPYLEIHPHTAEMCGVTDGDTVVVESPRGSLFIKAQVTTGIIPQLVHIPHGWATTDCNLLTDHEKRDPISGFPGLKSSLCRVRKI